MHLLVHALIGVLAGWAAGLSAFETAILTAGGLLIDLDHLLNILLVQKKRTLKSVIAWIDEENRLHRPHFFALHTIEAVALLSLISYFSNRLLFIFSLGMFLHYLSDAAGYILIRSSYPWKKYFSLLYYLISKPPK